MCTYDSKSVCTPSRCSLSGRLHFLFCRYSTEQRTTEEALMRHNTYCICASAFACVCLCAGSAPLWMDSFSPCLHSPINRLSLRLFCQSKQTNRRVHTLNLSSPGCLSKGRLLYEKKTRSLVPEWSLMLFIYFFVSLIHPQRNKQTGWSVSFNTVKPCTELSCGFQINSKGAEKWKEHKMKQHIKNDNKAF